MIKKKYMSASGRKSVNNGGAYNLDCREFLRCFGLNKDFLVNNLTHFVEKFSNDF